MQLEMPLCAYRSHNYPVWDVKWAPTGHYFASASHDKTARVWAMDVATPRRIMVGHLADVDVVTWHPNCNYIATGSSDRTLRLWDVSTGECVRIFTGHRGGIRSIAMSPDGKSMASGSDDGGILTWDLGSAKCERAFAGHAGAVYSLDYAGGDATLLASGGADETVRLWDVTTGSGSVVAGGGGTAGGGTKKRAGAVKTLRTRSTPVYAVKFTRRNLLIGMGARAPPKSREAVA
jgi:transcription initiation factor TFIID subunit 5